MINWQERYEVKIGKKEFNEVKRNIVRFNKLKDEEYVIRAGEYMADDINVTYKGKDVSQLCTGVIMRGDLE